MKPRNVIVMPAYNAAPTLERIVASIPEGVADEIIVVDDASTDETREIARRLPVTLVEHSENRGYGANQKTCYRLALERGASYIVMLHPDDQYDARMTPAALDVLSHDICDVVLGNRIRTRREALGGGMPLVKYLANRGLTFIENILSGQNLGEWHSGFRAYRRSVLETIPFDENDDGFAFDSQFLVQSVQFGFRIGDVPVPVRYFSEASTIGLAAATGYALRTGLVFGEWYLHRLGLRRSPRLSPKPAGTAGADPRSESGA
ncbi:MAG: glycosyltransferase family 2 protein [Acidobacteriota bacterium]